MLSLGITSSMGKLSGVSITPLIFTEAHKSASPQTAVRRGEALYGLFDAETGAIWNN